MTIPFSCPHCGHHTAVDNQFAGRTGPCVSCGNMITVPTASGIAGQGNQSGAGKRSQRQLPWIKLGMIVGGLISVCVLGIVVWNILQPAVMAAREVAKISDCRSNLERIGQAIEEYRAVHNGYPPSMTRDENGKPLHSWRVLILPYLGPEAASLYKELNLSEPWDSPENSLAILKMPTVYQCPSDASVFGETSYMAVVGPNTIINGVSSTRGEQITDNLHETLMVIETSGSTLNWMQPKDVNIASMNELNGSNQGSARSEHPQGVNALMADGNVIRLDELTSGGDLRSMSTIDGNEYIEALDQVD